MFCNYLKIKSLFFLSKKKKNEKRGDNCTKKKKNDNIKNQEIFEKK
jgi:hypothetical protein